jgi:hypothetical protein
LRHPDTRARKAAHRQLNHGKTRVTEKWMYQLNNRTSTPTRILRNRDKTRTYNLSTDHAADTST